MIDFGNVLAVLAAFTIVTISPGPANLAVAVTAMSHGRRTSYFMAFGLAVGLSVWGIVAAMGLGAILATSEKALYVLKIGGAAYLFWLAFLSARQITVNEYNTDDAEQHRKSSNWFLRGLILNLSNPKAVFAWLAALSLGAVPEASFSSVMVSTGLCMGIGLLNYYIWATVFSFDVTMGYYRQFKRRVDGLTTALFSIAAFGLLRSAFAK